MGEIADSMPVRIEAWNIVSPIRLGGVNDLISKTQIISNRFCVQAFLNYASAAR
jgi:hypothetical protein